MNNATVKTLLASALIVAGTGMAMAKGLGNGQMDFETLDVDGNGEITAEDFAALRENQFDAVDTDGDGTVSEAEFVAHAEARAGERAAEVFARMDADGDGSLSRDALEQRNRGGNGARMISRFDTDDSGGISAEEFEAASSKMTRQRGQDRKRGERGWGQRRN